MDGKALRSPNDLVFDSSGGFYFTSFGRMTADSIDFGGVYWARPDGSEIRELDSGVANLAFGGPNLRTLYVTLTQSGRLVSVPWPRPGAKLQYQAA